MLEPISAELFGAAVHDNIEHEKGLDAAGAAHRDLACRPWRGFHLEA